MSAWVVSQAHINAMVSAGLRRGTVQGCKLSWYHDGERHELTRVNADQVGSMLLGENIRSVGFRYSDSPVDDLPGRYVTAELPGFDVEIRAPEYLAPFTYKHTLKDDHRKPVEILKAIDCFEYQACETDDWRDSEAYAFCQALRSRMIDALPGYDDAPWGID